jgi:cytochrome c peroxidase
MRRQRPWRPSAAVTVLLLLAAGCRPADRYSAVPRFPPSTRGETAAPADDTRTLPPLEPDILWDDPGDRAPANEVRIEFVHVDRDAQRWRRLPQFWNDSLPNRAAAFVGLGPLGSGALVASAAEPVVRIRVPPGLDDPTPYVPSTNPLTLGRWNLGRELFFNDTWLETKKTGARAGVSCAGCHRPRQGFTDGVRAHADGFNTPTLINCVFNARQFWDGRVALLEEVVQRSLEDEREPTGPEQFHHVWHGVIGRLRENSRLTYLFQKVFNTPPTQDAVGRALATYLRTLLAANSIHDRAEARARAAGKGLGPDHYAAVLAAPGTLAELGRPQAKPEDVADELYHGYALFHGLQGRGRTNCVTCHSGRQFTDGRFHNLGWDDAPPEPGKERGRFTSVPVGQKDRYLIDAYKTPSLRGLLRTGPYLHNGRTEELRDVVAHHARGGAFLDPRMRLPAGGVRGDDLTAEEIDALVLFLRALNGEETPAALDAPPKP